MFSFVKQVGNDQNATTTTILMILVSFLILYKLLRRRSKLNLPPSPPKLPIIGNIHQIGKLPHRSFQALSQKYGPVMLLQLGQLPLVVVSSADMAREVMQTNDVVFASRPHLTSTKSLLYGCKDIVFATYGEAFRQKKKLCVTEFLNLKRVQSFQFIMEEEVASLMNDDKLRNGFTVNLTEMLSKTTDNILCRSIFGRKYDDRLGDLVQLMSLQIAEFCVGDFFPLFAWVDVLNGKINKFNKTFQKLDAFIDLVIATRRMERQDSENKYFLDVLLQLQDTGMSEELHLTQDDLKALLVDMVLGGTGTSLTTVEWAMAQLMKNPAMMKKAQEEVRRVVGNKTKIQDSDMNKMEYMKSIIKESLRLHPPAPFLIPRLTTSNVKLGGYDIPNNTMVYVNAWAIQQDPQLWERPEEFLPERFQNNNVNFNGLDFHFVPFGSGRRKCPGIAFGLSSVESMLSNLLCWFDWKLPNNCASPQDMDLTEEFGLGISKKVPLYLQAIPYNNL